MVVEIFLSKMMIHPLTETTDIRKSVWFVYDAEAEMLRYTKT